MQTSDESYSSSSVNKNSGKESGKSTPVSSPTGSGPDTLDKPRPKCMSDSSESEEEDVSEVESFMIDQEVDDRLEGSKFLLGNACHDGVDPETQERLEALLQAAGIGRLTVGDGKHLADPEVLRRLTSSVSCALDEAAAALTRMRTDHPRPAPESRSLAEACSDGDVTTVRKLLTEGGKSVHETNEDGESLLSLACSAGYLELAQVLIAMNANVEDRGVKGDCTPLMEAASAGHVDIVALLLNHNAQVNAQSASGNTALMYACAGGHESVVKLLLECAANVEDHNENGHTPLMEAASAGHVGVAQILLNYGAGINTHSNEFKESALTLACYKGHLDMVRFLLEAGADQEHKTDEMHTALMEASMDGHVEVARLLLDSGAQVNMPTDSFESPLTLAACGGHTELALLLIERGANIEEVNDEGYTPLMEAAREGHEDMVALLLSQGANINAQTEETQETALTLACCGGFLEVADFLLKAGADLEAGASTPLMEASQEGHLDLVRYLLEYHHAQVNAQSQTGDTALTYACENGHTDVASLLLLYGADLEHESEGGRTPLMKACRAGHTYTVQYLISKDADVNKATTNNDHTPLSLAASGGHLAVVELLLANHADPFHRLKDNSTMLIEAAKGGHTAVVHLLLDYPHCVMMSSAEGENRKVAVPLTDGGGGGGGGTPAIAGAPLAVEAAAAPLAAAPVEGATPAARKTPAQTAEADAESVASSAPQNPTQSSPLVQVQRSLLRKLRPPSSSEPGLTSAEAQQVRSQPVGEPEEIATPVVETGVQLPPGQTFHVSQNTAISDRPKAKPFSKKDGKTLRKVLNQPLQTAPADAVASPTLPSQAHQQPPQQFPMVSPQPGQQQPSLQQQQQSDAISIDKRGNVYHVQQVDRDAVSEQLQIQLLQKHHQLYMMQRQAEEQELVLASAVPDQAKAKDKDDQIDTLLMEAFSLDDVSNATTEQERLILRARQELSQQLALTPDEEAYDFLTQQQQQDHINVPALESHQNPNENHYPFEHLYVPRVDVGGLQITSTPLQLPTSKGHPLTVSRTTEGNIRITGPTSLLQMCTPPTADQNTVYPTFPVGYSSSTIPPPETDTNGTDLSLYKQNGTQKTSEGTSSYSMDDNEALGFMLGLMANKDLGIGTGNSMKDNMAIAKKALQQSKQNKAASTGTAFCCPNTMDPPARTQVQVATQTTAENKKSQPCPPVKGKKMRFPAVNQRHGGAFVQPTNTDAAGLGQCPGAFPPQQGAPASTLQLSTCMDVDSETDSNHDTALTLACAGGHEELVELLLSRGADIEHRDKKGFTPLILAATAGHEKVVEILLNRGADIEAQSERTKDTPLSLACSGGRYEVVELLLTKMANKEHRNVSDYTPLSLAASGGYVNIIKLLLSHGAEINSRTGSKLGISPLMLASMNGHVAAVKLLLDMGSDINAQIETNRNTALTLACFQGRHEVVSLLLDRKAHVEHRAKTGLTPLMEAASGGYVEVGRVLIDKGADVNASPVPSSRDTALTIAADKGHVRFVELLLSRKAMVEVKNKKGNSPLWLAANGGHLAVVELLYNLDADIDSQDNRKVSCLMAAFRKGHIKVVKWMVNHVTQFPSDQEMTRFIATITDKELLDKCHECVKVIRAAKDLQSAKANKNASILLEELDKEKTREESKKAAAARRRERKKKKKLEKKEERRKLYEENQKPESDDDDEEAEAAEAEAEAQAAVAERLGSSSPVADKEEGDSGIDANSQGSCSSNDVKAKEVATKRKEKKKKKAVDKASEAASASKVPSNEPEDKPNDRRGGGGGGDINRHYFEAVTDLKQDSAVMHALRNYNNNIRQEERREPQRHPAEREDFEATGNETYVSASKGRKNNQLNHADHDIPVKSSTSPKALGKREEGWKEVVRNFPYRSKKVSVPQNAISRVIGRGGSNINAIRNATGAHIEVEKQGKGQGERIITIKGSADATKQAHTLIGALIKEPDVDLTQMLPRLTKTPSNLVWEKSTVATTVKPKANSSIAGSGKPIPFTSGVGILNIPVTVAPLPVSVAFAASAPPAAIPPPASISACHVKTSYVPNTTPGKPSLVKVSQVSSPPSGLRSLVTGEVKRTSGGSTKTTMTYTSAIMTSGRNGKPLIAKPAPTPATTVTPIPLSPQPSPPHPLPLSPKHIRPLPTSSAPPSVQPSSSAGHHGPELVPRNVPQEYTLFNEFPKATMWGREHEAGKLNFASVAATGAPTGKLLEEPPAPVDVSKAPGYRASMAGCSPGGAGHSPRAEPPPPMVPLLDGQAVYAASRNFEPTCFPDVPFQLQPSPPPPSVALSRLNPRAPDFALGGKPPNCGYPRPQPLPQQQPQPQRWPYTEIVYPAVSDLLTTYDNGLAGESLPGPLEDRKPRPIGTERHWKMNGYEHQDWIDGKPWANYQRAYRYPDDTGLLDAYPAMPDTAPISNVNGTALAHQLLRAHPQHHQMPTLDHTTWDESSWGHHNKWP